MKLDLILKKYVFEFELRDSYIRILIKTVYLKIT